MTHHRPARPKASRTPAPGTTPVSKADGLESWKARLIHRRYTDEARLTPRREFSARIEHLGTAFYFPLGTEEIELAARKAREIHRVCQAQGWDVARQRFEREIALAVLWNSNPFACTYTTLVTEPGSPAADSAPREPAAGLIRVGIVEREPGVRRALARWIDYHAGFSCARCFAELREAQPHLGQIELLLFNHRLPELAEEEFRRKIEAQHPGLLSFGFGIYEDSDQIFASVTGVTGGYLLRRRVPAQLLDPVNGPWRERVWTRAAVRAQVEQYFRNLFSLRWPSEVSSSGAKLTAREIEILHCLRQGFPDKVIAQALNLSVWTVHTHLKKIFEKLSAHTRTEAVAKYLQK